MLSPDFLRLKKLSAAGDFAGARALIGSAQPQSDEDALEVLICMHLAGEVEALAQYSAQRGWQSGWPAQAARGLNAIATRREIQAALGQAREAAGNPNANASALAIYLILLQMNGQIDDAAAVARERATELPAGETLLLTALGEVAATIGDWTRAQAAALSVLIASPHNVRALQICSVVNFESGNVHEALGNAIHANKVKPGDQTTALQLMKCYNKLADFYSAIAAYDNVKSQGALLPEIHAQLGYANARLENLPRAIECYRESLRSGRISPTALRGLIHIYINTGATRELEQLVTQHRDAVYQDLEIVGVLARERLQARDLDSTHRLLRHGLELAVEQGLGYSNLTWPVPEPRLRHDREQLELLQTRGKLSASGAEALATLNRHAPQDLKQKIAPHDREGELLRHALAEYHYCPDPPFSGTALGDNDYGAIEDGYMQSSPKLAVIDNFLSPAALAALREYCEEATIWKSYFDNGYVGTLFGSGFCPHVLLAIADQLKMMMPRVIGALPLTQAWAFKYDQRLTGINMHADFASVNVNFWITPDEACLDKATGGLVIYDVPAPREWTYEDYNGKSAKQAAFLAMHGAKARRVPYRENRCVLFDSTLFHTTDEIHFAPGYRNRRVNVTLLYGKSLNAD